MNKKQFFKDTNFLNKFLNKKNNAVVSWHRSRHYNDWNLLLSVPPVKNMLNKNIIAINYCDSGYSTAGIKIDLNNTPLKSVIYEVGYAPRSMMIDLTFTNSLLQNDEVVNDEHLLFHEYLYNDNNSKLLLKKIDLLTKYFFYYSIEYINEANRDLISNLLSKYTYKDFKKEFFKHNLISNNNKDERDMEDQDFDHEEGAYEDMDVYEDNLE